MSEVIDLQDWKDRKALDKAREEPARSVTDTVMLIKKTLENLDKEVKR